MELILIEDMTRLLKESSMVVRPLKPEEKLPMETGNDGLLAVPWGRKTQNMKKGNDHTELWDPALNFRCAQLWYLNGRETSLPLSAQRARRRIESLSPRLRLSSLLEVERVGRVTPMTSTHSRRVNAEERRRWWEMRFVVGCET
jgi:hypothetical protein